MRTLHNFFLFSLLAIVVLILGSQTFPRSTQAAPVLSDTFSGTTINTSIWNKIDAAGTNIGLDGNGHATITNSYGPPWGKVALSSKNTFDRTGLIVTAQMWYGSAQLLGYGDYNFQSPGTSAYMIDLTSNSILGIVWNNGGGVTNKNCGTAQSGIFYRMQLTAAGFDIYKSTNGSTYSFVCSVPGVTTFTNKPIFLQSASTVSYVDNVSVALPAQVPNIHITKPARSVTAEPNVATISITDQGGTFSIPYIQTGTILPVAATIDAGALPAGGGVKFVLDQGTPSEVVQFAMSEPFETTFTNLAKGVHRLDTYIVDAFQTLQVGAGNQDTATNIGVGDIIIAIGDSITEGYYGPDFGATPITNWLNAPLGSTSSDGRNFPQYGPTSHTYKLSWVTSLNNPLAANYGYPVFILNEGWGSRTTGTYLNNVMQDPVWKAGIEQLKPNKWLILLGANDSVQSLPAATYQSNLQAMIDQLISTYGAESKNIWLAKPTYGKAAPFNYEVNYLPVVDSLITVNNLSRGPDFWNLFKNHIDYYGGDPIHPTTVGHAEMARVWGLSMIAPKNVRVVQNAGVVVVQWDALSASGSTIAGYKIRYGKAPGSYTATVTSNTNSVVLAGLATSTTYYVSVSAYDNDTTPNETGLSSEVSFVTPAILTNTFSDTFSGTTINTAIWNELDSQGTNITLDGSGHVAISNSYNSVWGKTALYSKSTFDRTGLTISAQMWYGSAQLLGYGDYNFQSPGTSAYMIDLTGSSVLGLVRNNGTGVVNKDCGAAQSGIFYQMQLTATGFDIYKSTNGSTYSFVCSVPGVTTFTNKPIFLQSASTVSYFDNVSTSY